MKVIHYLLIFLVAVVLSSLVLAQTSETERPVVVSAVVPVYPAIAESARVTGDVTVGVEIDAKGKVKEARADGKIRLLAKVAEEAAHRWEFAPSQTGQSKRKVELVFSFRLTPEKASSLDSTSVFFPPYRIEIRKKPEKLVQMRSY